MAKKASLKGPPYSDQSTGIVTELLTGCRRSGGSLLTASLSPAVGIADRIDRTTRATRLAVRACPVNSFGARPVEATM